MESLTRDDLPWWAKLSKSVASSILHGLARSLDPESEVEAVGTQNTAKSAVTTVRYTPDMIYDCTLISYHYWGADFRSKGVKASKEPSVHQTAIYPASPPHSYYLGRTGRRVGARPIPKSHVPRYTYARGMRDLTNRFEQDWCDHPGPHAYRMLPPSFDTSKYHLMSQLSERFFLEDLKVRLPKAISRT